MTYLVISDQIVMTIYGREGGDNLWFYYPPHAEPGHPNISTILYYPTGLGSRRHPADASLDFALINLK